MLSLDEVERVKLKALEQALQAAGIANADPIPLLPILEPAAEQGDWPFKLSKLDVLCLRSCPYPISPA